MTLLEKRKQGHAVRTLYAGRYNRSVGLAGLEVQPFSPWRKGLEGYHAGVGDGYS